MVVGVPVEEVNKFAVQDLVYTEQRHEEIIAEQLQREEDERKS